MTIKIKDSQKLEEEILLSGFSLSEFSRKLKKCRTYMHAALKNRSVGPSAAKEISKKLNVPFSTHFELIKEDKQ